MEPSSLHFLLFSCVGVQWTKRSAAVQYFGEKCEKCAARCVPLPLTVARFLSFPNFTSGLHSLRKDLARHRNWRSIDPEPEPCLDDGRIGPREESHWGWTTGDLFEPI